MSSMWYVKMAGQVAGPLSAGQLKTLAASGRLLPDQLVAQSPAGPWVPARRVRGLFSNGVGQEGSGSSAQQLAGQTSPAVSPPGSSVPDPPPVYAAPPPAVAPPVATGGAPAPYQPGGKATGANCSVARRRRRQSNMLIAVTLSVILFAGLGIAAVWVLNSATLPAPPASIAGRQTGANAGGASRRTVAKPEVKIAGLDEFLSETEQQPNRETTEPASEAVFGGQSSRATGADKPTSSGSPVWHDASKGPIHIGDLEVRVTEVRIARPTLIVAGNNRAWPKQAKLIVDIRLTNHSDKQEIEYSGWSQRSFDRGGARLLDSADRPCSPWSYPGAKVEGCVKKAALAPGKAIDDVLVFPKPESVDGPLRLELSWAAIGDEGSCGFKIPATMIVHETDAENSPPAAPGGDAEQMAKRPGAVAEGQSMEQGPERPPRGPEPEVDDGGPIPIPGLDEEAPRGKDREPQADKPDRQAPKGTTDSWPRAVPGAGRFLVPARERRHFDVRTRGTAFRTPTPRGPERGVPWAMTPFC